MFDKNQNKKIMEKEEIKACTSCKKIPEVHQHSIDGSVYHNLICFCKKTPLERCSLGANIPEWNSKWFETDPQIVNKKAGFETDEGIYKKFHYFT